MSISPEDPILTAYALGELDDDHQRAMVEQALAGDSALVREVAALRETGRSLEEACTHARLPHPVDESTDLAELSRRLEMTPEWAHATAGDRKTPGRLITFPTWIAPMALAAAVAVLLAATFLLDTPTQREGGSVAQGVEDRATESVEESSGSAPASISESFVGPEDRSADATVREEAPSRRPEAPPEASGPDGSGIASMAFGYEPPAVAGGGGLPAPEAARPAMPEITPDDTPTNLFAVPGERSANAAMPKNGPAREDRFSRQAADHERTRRPALGIARALIAEEPQEVAYPQYIPIDPDDPWRSVLAAANGAADAAPESRVYRQLSEIYLPNVYFTDVPLRQALVEIENLANANSALGDVQIELEADAPSLASVELDASNQSLGRTLGTILRQARAGYRIEGERIVITPEAMDAAPGALARPGDQ